MNTCAHPHVGTGTRTGAAPSSDLVPATPLRRLQKLAGCLIALAGLLVGIHEIGKLLPVLLFDPAWEGSRQALAGGMLAALATALGALPVLFMRQGLSVRTQDTMLGFAAGVMLAASAFSLILPAIATGHELVGSRAMAAGLAALSLLIGVLTMFLIERWIPHTHENEAAQLQAGVRGVWLLVAAMLIHNFPEGLAIGAAFSGSNPAGGWPVAIAIAIQDIPEGLVVALALMVVGYSRALAAGIGIASGLAEPVGALASALVVSSTPILYPMGLALAAGAMIFVVSHEIIPGTHRRGHEAAATLGVSLGFALMMVLDNAFAG